RWPRDWSSDVCSSDLAHDGQAARAAIEGNRAQVVKQAGADEVATAQARAALEDPIDGVVGEDVATLERARALVASARAALKTFRSEERRVGEERREQR